MSSDCERTGVATQQSGPGGLVSQEEMINITSCDYIDFAKYMCTQYGTPQFNQGFQIVKGQQDLIYRDDGEEMLL